MPQNSNSVIQFFNVPWDSGYRNLRHFDSADARDSYFDSLVTAFDEYPDPNYDHSQSVWVDNATPIKYGVPYVVSKNWDTMHLYNYCRYKNRGYTNAEWQYCFVTAWEYVSQHSSKFSFVRDAWVNNVGKMEIGECFIEREHTDTVTDLPEPVSINRYVCRKYENALATPIGGGDWTLSGGLRYFLIASTDSQGKVLENQEFIMNEVRYPFQINSSESFDIIQDAINAYAENGYLDNIVSVFAVPKEWVTEISLTNWTFRSGEFKLTRTDGGYAPKNAKCNHYPFKFCQLVDWFGNSQELKWEDFGDDEITVFFEGFLGVNSYAQLIPENGNSMEYGRQTLTHGINAPVGFNASAFQNWVAQNMTAIKNAREAFAINSSAQIASGILGIGGSMLGGNYMGAGMQATGLALNQKAALDTFELSQNTLMAQASFIPNKSSVPDGSTLGIIKNGQVGFAYYCVEPCGTELRALDNFFTRFGYAVNRLGVPSIGDRAYYFCKTSGAVVKGRCPIEDRDLIAKVFDRGVTVWKTDNIGNY